MWVNKTLFDTVLADNKSQAHLLSNWQNTCYTLQAKYDVAQTQKAKDDITIDWMRHRINALEKINAQLLIKAAGVHIAVPEIVPTRPGSISDPVAAFDQMPSFEDVGDTEAARLGAMHDDEGVLAYTK